MGHALQPSSWLDLARSELQVPSPGQDGWRYNVPKVGLVDEAPAWLGDPGPVLVWDFDNEGRPPVEPSARILDEFVRLAIVSEANFAQAVLSFAARYGP